MLRTYEFRTEEWAEHYVRRIDATVVALKAAGVPVFWVGLPSIRGPKSTGEMLYLNDLYRTRAEKAGVTYIDVWDGFVDESGRFAVQGPDFEGQIRRLRVSDGVHFTKSGARKLAHYLEREVRRMMQRGTELVALPAEPQAPQPSGRPGAATARPLSGPVVPLTASATAEPGIAGRRRFHRQRQSARRRRACWSRARRSIRRPAAATTSAGRAAASRPSAPIRPSPPPPIRCRSRLRPRRRSPRRLRRGRSEGRVDVARLEEDHRPQPAADRAAAAQSPPRQEQPQLRQLRWWRFGGLASAERPLISVELAPRDQRGSDVVPIRNLSIAWAHWRPSRIAHTTSDWPRRMSPAANTFDSVVR